MQVHGEPAYIYKSPKTKPNPNVYNTGNKSPGLNVVKKVPIWQIANKPADITIL